MLNSGSSEYTVTLLFFYREICPSASPGEQQEFWDPCTCTLSAEGKKGHFYASVSYLRQMMKSGLESIIIPPLTKEDIHVCSLDQIPLRRWEFGNLEASQTDLGLNLKSLNFPRESKGVRW